VLKRAIKIMASGSEIRADVNTAADATLAVDHLPAGGGLHAGAEAELAAALNEGTTLGVMG
jgi:hypothetical protein